MSARTVGLRPERPGHRQLRSAEFPRRWTPVCHRGLAAGFCLLFLAHGAVSSEESAARSAEAPLEGAASPVSPAKSLPSASSTAAAPPTSSFPSAPPSPAAAAASPPVSPGPAAPGAPASTAAQGSPTQAASPTPSADGLSPRGAAPAQNGLVHAAPAFDPAFFPVHFPPGESRLGIDSRAILEYMAQTLVNAPSTDTIRIVGRSDGFESSPFGNTPEGRLELSRARATGVRDYLVGRGIPSARFVVVGLGSSSPIADLESSRDRDRNRVVLLEKMAAPAGPGEEGVIRISAGRRPDGVSDAGTGAASQSSSGSPAPSTGGSTGVSGAPPGDAPSGSTGKADAGAPTGVTEPTQEVEAFRTTGRSAMVASEVGKNRLTGPAVVQTVQISLKLLRRDGPGAVGSGSWPLTSFLQQEMPALEQLFRNGLSRERALVGESRVYLSLDKTGKVTAAELRLPYPHPDFAREMQQYFMSWQLPPPPAGDSMGFELAFTVYATFQNLLAPIQ